MNVLLILCIPILFFLIIRLLISSYDERGFNRKGIHKNGTKYDDFGFDINGFDRNGYNKNGYNQKGFDVNGYNEDGYNIDGKDYKGRYNRLYDIGDYRTSEYSKDGFLNPKFYPIAVTDHARERIQERFVNSGNLNVYKIARNAYCFGKSSRQIKRTSSALIKDIEERYDNRIALIYSGYIYIFSEKNELITMYKNDKIPL